MAVAASPPSESASDLADFHQRQGHAPRFAEKDGKLRLVYAGWDDAKVFSLTAAGKLAGGWKGETYPPQG